MQDLLYILVGGEEIILNATFIANLVALVVVCESISVICGHFGKVLR